VWNMKIDGLVVFSIIFCLGCSGTCLAPMVVCAQPEASLPAYVWEGPVPGGYITGYVLDENGVPVPGATVSLLQEGNLWQPDKYGYPSLPYGINPQTTRIAYHDNDSFLNEGGFLFGLPIPDEYTLAAEKDGYKGSASVHIAHELLYPNASSGSVSRTFTVNITLKGYHQPTFSPEQLSYTGAIFGEIRGVPGYHVGANISLWQDGRMVKMPNNPQYTLERNYSGKEVDYMFEHLPPGNYTILAEYIHGGNYCDTITVDVDTRPMRADMVLSNATKAPPYGYPTIRFTPTIGVFSASDARPTPALPGLFVLLLIGIVEYFTRKNNKY
jgi:hypothetical protein